MSNRRLAHSAGLPRARRGLRRRAYKARPYFRAKKRLRGRDSRVAPSPGAAARSPRGARQYWPGDACIGGIHLALGKLKLNAGNLDDAEKEFRAETALSPGDGEAAWRLGSVLLQKGRAREALIELERSGKLRPQMIETLFDLGKAYS